MNINQSSIAHDVRSMLTAWTALKFRNALRWACAALLALAAWGVHGTGATTLARMDVRDLAQHANYIALVRCVSAVSQPDSSLIWTLTTFEVSEAWKGNPPSPFTLRLPGGEAAGRRVTVEGAPRFAAGEEAVLFLEAGSAHHINIVGWAQGTFRIRHNARTGAAEAVQDTAGVQVLDPRSGTQSAGHLRILRLAELRLAVVQAIHEASR